MKKMMVHILSMVVLLSCLAGCNTNDSSALSANDFQLNINGKSYETGADIQTVIGELGSEYEYSDGLSCAYDGLDKTYVYDMATFYTNPLSQGDIVVEIYTDNPSVSTSKGVIVGMTKEEVISAYGEGTEDTGNLLLYRIPQNNGTSSGSLCFEIDSGEVDAIFITTET